MGHIWAAACCKTHTERNSSAAQPSPCAVQLAILTVARRLKCTCTRTRLCSSTVHASPDVLYSSTGVHNGKTTTHTQMTWSTHVPICAASHAYMLPRTQQPRVLALHVPAIVKRRRISIQSQHGLQSSSRTTPAPREQMQAKDEGPLRRHLHRPTACIAQRPQAWAQCRWCEKWRRVPVLLDSCDEFHCADCTHDEDIMSGDEEVVSPMQACSRAFSCFSEEYIDKSAQQSKRYAVALSRADLINRLCR